MVSLRRHVRTFAGAGAAIYSAGIVGLCQQCRLTEHLHSKAFPSRRQPCYRMHASFPAAESGSTSRAPSSRQMKPRGQCSTNSRLPQRVRSSRSRLRIDFTSRIITLFRKLSTASTLPSFADPCMPGCKTCAFGSSPYKVTIFNETSTLLLMVRTERSQSQCRC